MAKTYREYAPTQGFLLPPSPLEWLPPNHLAYFILDTVQTLDLSAITSHYERELRGYPPHDPRMMVALLLYAYCVGVPSSRRIARKTHEDVAFRVIAGNTHPDHTCVSEFRRIHLSALAALFVDVLRTCRALGLVKLGHVALDGTKVEANASKHKAMSHERMKKDEERLTQKVVELLTKAQQVDDAEDAEHGVGVDGSELPAELSRAETRLERIRAARAALEAEAAQQASAREAASSEDAQAGVIVEEMKRIDAARDVQERGSDDDEPPAPPSPEAMPSHQLPTEKGELSPKAQRNFTDADSRIMLSKGAYVQAYNAQIAVDEGHQIIVAHGVSNQPPDCEHLVPMLDRIVENLGAVPDKATADSGYFSEANVARTTARGIDAYIAVGRTKHHDDKAPPTIEGTAKARMAEKLATDEGKRAYARRKAVVEPVFGQLKNLGYRRFLLRGIAKVRGEWALMALAHNLLKLFGATRARLAAA